MLGSKQFIYNIIIKKYINNQKSGWLDFKGFTADSYDYKEDLYVLLE